MSKLMFSTIAYKPLMDSMITMGDFEVGQLTRKDFPDSEHYTRFLTPINGRNVILIGGTINDRDTLEIYDLACGIVDAGAQKLWIVIPYYGYSTMERAVNEGEIIMAKTRARLLSSINHGSGIQFILLDLHVDSIACYFEGPARTVHLHGTDLLITMIRSVADSNDFILASTDAGRAKQVQSLANYLGVFPAFVFKRRLDSGATEVSAVSAQVDGKQVIIYDDMIRTGGSLINAVKAYKDAGASKISVVTTHGVFAGDAIKKLQECGLINKIVVTDSHPNATLYKSDFVSVFSVDTMLTNFLIAQ
jgi:ribose-phosphate pyrophosphokinase